jgi:hypothetical protein
MMLAMNPDDEILEKYETEYKHLVSQVNDLERERVHMLYLLVGVGVSPLFAFYKPLLGVGLTALFLTLFATGWYFNFVHRAERAMHLENAERELARLRREHAAREKPAKSDEPA